MEEIRLVTVILAYINPLYRRQLVSGWFDYALQQPFQVKEGFVRALMESLSLEERMDIVMETHTTEYGSSGKLLNQFLCRWSHKMVCSMLESLETIDNRYQVLSYHNETGTPLHCAVDWSNCTKQTLRAMLDSVDQDKPYQLLQIKRVRCLTALHVAVLTRQHDMIETMRDVLSSGWSFSPCLNLDMGGG